jgi:hypothetical protein
MTKRGRMAEVHERSGPALRSTDAFGGQHCQAVGGVRVALANRLSGPMSSLGHVGGEVGQQIVGERELDVRGSRFGSAAQPLPAGFELAGLQNAIRSWADKSPADAWFSTSVIEGSPMSGLCAFAES